MLKLTKFLYWVAPPLQIHQEINWSQTPGSTLKECSSDNQILQEWGWTLPYPSRDNQSWTPLDQPRYHSELAHSYLNLPSKTMSCFKHSPQIFLSPPLHFTPTTSKVNGLTPNPPTHLNIRSSNNTSMLVSHFHKDITQSWTSPDLFFQNKNLSSVQQI